MQEIEQVLKARDALATVKYIDQFQIDPAKVPGKLLTEIAEYSRSHPGRAPDYHTLNEATIVLLSAYLEGFVEELHAEAIGQLLHEKIQQAGVLEALLDYAHRQFGNPTPDKIVSLFSTCGFKDMISSLGPDEAKIRRFVKIRNKIAHGEHVSISGEEVETWVETVKRFAERLGLLVEAEIIKLED